MKILNTIFRVNGYKLDQVELDNRTAFRLSYNKELLTQWPVLTDNTWAYDVLPPKYIQKLMDKVKKALRTY